MVNNNCFIFYSQGLSSSSFDDKIILDKFDLYVFFDGGSCFNNYLPIIYKGVGIESLEYLEICCVVEYVIIDFDFSLDTKVVIYNFDKLISWDNFYIDDNIFFVKCFFLSLSINVFNVSYSNIYINPGFNELDENFGYDDSDLCGLYKFNYCGDYYDSMDLYFVFLFSILHNSSFCCGFVVESWLKCCNASYKKFWVDYFFIYNNYFKHVLVDDAMFFNSKSPGMKSKKTIVSEIPIIDTGCTYKDFDF